MPYKQRVGGSRPSTPTRQKKAFRNEGLFIFIMGKKIDIYKKQKQDTFLLVLFLLNIVNRTICFTT